MELVSKGCLQTGSTSKFLSFVIDKNDQLLFNMTKRHANFHYAYLNRLRNMMILLKTLLVTLAAMHKVSILYHTQAQQLCYHFYCPDNEA